MLPRNHWQAQLHCRMTLRLDNWRWWKLAWSLGNKYVDLNTNEVGDTSEKDLFHKKREMKYVSLPNSAFSLVSNLLQRLRECRSSARKFMHMCRARPNPGASPLTSRLSRELFQRDRDPYASTAWNAPQLSSPDAKVGEIQSALHHCVKHPALRTCTKGRPIPAINAV